MDDSVREKFTHYPERVAQVLLNIRALIFNAAKESDINNLEETLKWGEPSYLSGIGSTIRFDWKTKHPEQFCIYFNCKTSLVDTFKELYGNTFTFQGNRALVFQLDQEIPTKALAHCLSLSLTYKKIKHLPMLGA